MSRYDSYDIAIIGGGIAGLAAAIRLKKRFDKVLIIEKNEQPGGKLAEFRWNNYRWDKGPSLFTEPELVDELFELWKKNPKAYFDYEQLDVSCNYYFKDRSHFKFSADDVTTQKALETFSNSATAEKVMTYKAQSKHLFEKVGDYFISNPQPKAKDLLSKELRTRYKYLFRKEVRNSLNDLNQIRLEDPRLVQVFNRFGTYNGSNPYKMSGLYSTIPHVELNKGAFFPKKGMRSIVEALTLLAEEIGVEICCNAQVKVKQTSDNRFTLTGDKNVTADKLVCAIDHVAFYRNVLKHESLAEQWEKPERSTSGLIFYWAVEERIPELGLHNIFFSADYKKEFEILFDQKKLALDPTFYVHISSVAEPEDADKNGQNWFVMVNTPAGVIPDFNYRKAVKQQLFERLESQFGVDLKSKILFEDFWDCHSIEEHSGSYLGALYGPSSNSLMASIKRHGNQSKKFSNLYFCGGTVHPGGGIPLVLRSAKIVSDLIV